MAKSKSHKVVLCNYCKSPARLCTSREIYDGRNFGGSYYKCDPCDAWVGCHRGTSKPLGTLAKAELRRLRLQTHALLDPLWKYPRTATMTRTQAYALLASMMQLPINKCHIALFNEEQCRRAQYELRMHRNIPEGRMNPSKMIQGDLWSK